MSTGLVFGKFMPVHTGHLALVDFAAARCEHLLVVLCTEASEPISAELRLIWLGEALAGREGVEILHLPYDPAELPNSSVSSREISRAWAVAFQQQLPPLDVVFTSEDYGDYLAEYMGIRHERFDSERLQQPICASQIRQRPWEYWGFIPQAVRPWFVTRVAIHGAESTGKSSLALLLAEHYKDAAYVPEAARELVSHTIDVTPEDLPRFALAQAAAIERAVSAGPRLLFVDTTLDTTRAYSRYLFGHEMPVPPGALASNEFHLHLYCEVDAPFVQDGTRLDVQRRLELNAIHREFLSEQAIELQLVKGSSWPERLACAIGIVDLFLGRLS